jgi:hypothetical protein
MKLPRIDQNLEKKDALQQYNVTPPPWQIHLLLYQSTCALFFRGRSFYLDYRVDEKFQKDKYRLPPKR